VEDAMSDERIKPDFDKDMIPLCSDHCPSFDGKRCEILGHRPAGICEPAVKALASRVEDLESDALATGDLLAAMLGVKRCEEGNICHANDLALRTTVLEGRLAGVRECAEQFHDTYYRDWIVEFLDGKIDASGRRK
jgi:hypothetical protein